MNIHISNVYGMIANRKIARNQSRFASVGHKLGYLELGIYNYYADDEPEKELERRIEGILGAVQTGDTVILQLPTGNGERFDKCLVKKTFDLQTKIVMIWHSLAYYFRNKENLAIWSNQEVTVDRVSEALACQNDSMIQQILIKTCNAEVMSSDMDYNVVHIGMEIHDKDSKGCFGLGVAMQSIVEHTNARIKFHIVHDGTLTDENKRRLTYIALRTEQQIEFYKIEELDCLKHKSVMDICAIETLYQVLESKVFQKIHRIIYLDLNVLVNCDVKELCDIDIDQYCFAAVQDVNIEDERVCVTPISVKKERYFHSGVIYMNFDWIRNKKNVKEKCQDAMLLLDDRWNYSVEQLENQNMETVKEGIYQYNGSFEILNYETMIEALYIQTAERIPWSSELLSDVVGKSISDKVVKIESLRKALANCQD